MSRDILVRLFDAQGDGALLASGAGQPAFFGPAARPLFGCWHAPTGAVSRDVAVVLCAPHGPEEAGTHRTLRQLATSLAADGSPVLRFDLDGCGDSAGDDLDPGRVQAWLSSIDAAIAAAREASGCPRVALVGVQLGALLSAQVLRRHPEVAAWIGIAPPASGRQFLRERLAMGALHADSDGSSDEALLESGGVPYTRASREALSTLSLQALDTALAATQLVVMQRSDLPLAASVRSSLPSRVDWCAVDGYSEMVRDAHHSVVPVALIDMVRERIASIAPTGMNGGVPASCFGRPRAQWDGLIETPVTLGAGLQGLLSLPVARPVRRTLLMLNAGAVRRTGPGRLYAMLARRWAARGVAVLRVDLGGLGDSPARPGANEQVVYGLHAVDDAVQAARWLAAVTGIAQTQVMGLCSGAVHAFEAALAGAPVERLVAINPLVFHYPAGAPLPAGMGAHAAAAVSQAVQRGWRGGGVWKRLVRGELPVRRIAQRVAAWAAVRAGHGVQRAVQWVCRTAGQPRPDDLSHALYALALQPVHQHFVFADGEPGAFMMDASAGRVVQRLESLGLVDRHAVADADHTFTTTLARQRLATCLDALVTPPTPLLRMPLPKAAPSPERETVEA